LDTLKIISGAMEQAKAAKQQGVTSVRLPVLSFSEFCRIFEREDDYSSRQDHRTHQKRNFYFKRFLEDQGIDVTMVTCRSEELKTWARETDHDLNTDQERTHALAHFVGRPELPAAACVHKRPLTTAMAECGLELFATLTTFGESSERPEILSTAVHTRDGQVVESLEVLAVEHSPQEAFGLCSEFMAKHGVVNAFHDQVVRRPEFCPDCGELLVNVAGPAEYNRLDNQFDNIEDIQ
jgi:hypothetical protein